MLLLTICAVICGADGWAEVEDFGQAKKGWLRMFLQLPHGVPSHDTLGRVFARLDPGALETCLMSWFKHLAQTHRGRLIAIDGKTLRHSFDTASKKAAIHMVSAWCEANHLVLGQLATDAKSNEIAAIPKRLELLDLTDAVVTIDAMGCQRAIAAQIIDQGGDYVLGLKANQGTLHQRVRRLFDEAFTDGWARIGHGDHETIEKDHGRIETRRFWCTDQIDRYNAATLGLVYARSLVSRVNAPLATRPRPSVATIFPASTPSILNASPKRSAATGASRIACIGAWT